jgi:hypothetical protein
MKMQLTVRTFTGGVSIVAQSDWTEVTDAELEEVESFVKQAAERGHYMSIGPTIIPGEFLRNHCVVDIRAEK